MSSSMCTRCYGKGKYDVIGNQPCNSCMGRGIAFTTNVGYKHGAACRTCGGRGSVQRMYKVTCTTCRGSGIITTLSPSAANMFANKKTFSLRFR